MKRLTIMVCAPIGVSAYALAAPALKVENIKQIVCESTVSYDEDSPNEKTAARGVKMFKPGSRKDVQRRPGAFLLAEVYPLAQSPLLEEPIGDEERELRDSRSTSSHSNPADCASY